MSSDMEFSVQADRGRASGRRRYKPGEPVVYRRSKISPRPGPRAEDIHPTSAGEDYAYCVDKYWVVVEDRGEEIVVRTRRGKEHVLAADDPSLRRPHWWEKLIHRERFPTLEDNPPAEADV